MSIPQSFAGEVKEHRFKVRAGNFYRRHCHAGLARACHDGGQSTGPVPNSEREGGACAVNMLDARDVPQRFRRGGCVSAATEIDAVYSSCQFDQLVPGALSLDPALVKDGDAVTQSFSFLHVVRCVEHCIPSAESFSTDSRIKFRD